MLESRLGYFHCGRHRGLCHMQYVIRFVIGLAKGLRRISTRTFNSFFDPNGRNLHIRVMIENLQMQGLELVKVPHHTKLF